MRIRRFTEKDVNKVSSIARKALMLYTSENYPVEVRNEFIRGHSRKNLLNMFKDREVFVACDGNKILGVIGLRNNNEIKNMFVNPAFHGKNIGSKLYCYVERIAKKRGIRKLIAYSSAHAEGFYRKMGFKKIKKITRVLETKKGKFKFPNVHMEKKI